MTSTGVYAHVHPDGNLQILCLRLQITFKFAEFNHETAWGKSLRLLGLQWLIWKGFRAWKGENVRPCTRFLHTKCSRSTVWDFEIPLRASARISLGKLHQWKMVRVYCTRPFSNSILDLLDPACERMREEHMVLVERRSAVSIIESLICSLLPWRPCSAESTGPTGPPVLSLVLLL